MTIELTLDSFFFNRLQLNQSLPEGAEIKIPGVGSTPIAISTQLPAAVAQLSQKGEFISWCGLIRIIHFD
jgi:hypothetical protein